MRFQVQRKYGVKETEREVKWKEDSQYPTLLGGGTLHAALAALVRLPTPREPIHEDNEDHDAVHGRDIVHICRDCQ